MHTPSLQINQEITTVDQRVNQLVSDFQSSYRESVEGILACGRILCEVDDETPEVMDQFLRRCPLGDSTQRKMKRIWMRLGDVRNAERLPSQWTTLYALSSFECSVVDGLIESGVVNPESTKSDIDKLVNSSASQAPDPDKPLVSKLKSLWRAERPISQLLASDLLKPEESVDIKSWLKDEMEAL